MEREEDSEKAPSGLLGTVLRGAGLAGGGYILAQAINLGVYIALSRLLTPTDFGQYAAATVLVGFGLLVTEGGMHSAIIQRRDRLEEAQSTAAVATLVAGILLGLLNLALAPVLGLIFDSSQVTALAAASSGLILIHTISVAPNAILQRRFSFLRMLVVGPVEVIAFGTGAIVFASIEPTPWALVAGQYAGAVVATTLAWILARWRPRMSQVSFGMWRELASYGRHVLLATTILRAGEQATPTLVVGTGIGSAALGQFRYAFRIASLPFAVLLAAAAYVIFPAFSRIAEQRGRLQAAFLRSLRWMSVLGFPAGMLLIPLGPPIAILVFGDVWEPAGYAAMAMCAYVGAGSISSAVSELIKADGTPAPLTRMHTITTVFTAAGMLAGAPFGLTEAAAGISVGAVAGAAYALRVANRVSGVSLGDMWAEVWPAATAATMMALVVLPLDRLVLEPAERGTAAGLALVAGELVLCALVFAAFLRVLAPQVPRELVDLIRSRGWRRGQGDVEPIDEPDPEAVGL